MADEEKKTKKEEKKEEKKEKKEKKETKKKEESKEESKDESKDVEVPAKFKDIVETIEQMSVIDLSELVEVLEDKFGVSASAPVAVAAAPGASGEDGGAEEKSEFDVELTEVGDSKINVIKAVRTITGQGLKDAKEMVDGAPTVIKEGVPKEEAEKIEEQLKEAGATVTLK